MNNTIDYKTLSLKEKRAFIIGLLDGIREGSEDLQNFYGYFSENENVTEKECDEVYTSIMNNI